MGFLEMVVTGGDKLCGCAGADGGSRGRGKEKKVEETER